MAALPGDDLVVSTPERVAFQYQVAGVATRFLAQLIDSVILLALLVATFIGAISAGALSRSDQVFFILVIVLSFVLLFGYFWAQEALWSGQTVGKRALRLRVVGDAGEPITFTQAAIRNLIRLIDFLPAYYGIGLITLFVNGRGKRLGDMAAGTLVVRDRASITLEQLTRATTPLPPQPGLPPPGWSLAAGPMPTGELQPALRRFVTTYAQRRWQLDGSLRASLAESLVEPLGDALPDVVAAYGPLAALERLADIESGRG